MPLSFEILRPDDLVALRVDALSLKLDTSLSSRPRLVVETSGEPALLVFHFPPQTLLEQAFFHVDPHAPPPPPFNPPPDPPLQAFDDPLPNPGEVGVRIGGESRLVFRLPSGVTSLDYNIASLLDWSKLELVLAATAAVPAGAAATSPPPPIAEPAASETAIELPYRLILSPAALQGRAQPSFTHATSPVFAAGRAELWHTRLVQARNAGAHGLTLTETTERDPMPVRAIWSPDFAAKGPLPPHSIDDEPFRSPMTARDRDQIVILTSGFDGYQVTSDAGAQTDYSPTPVDVSKLYLSALGGWLTSKGTWPENVSYTYPLFPILRPPSATDAQTDPGLRDPGLRDPEPRPRPIPIPDPLPIPIHLPTATDTLDLVAWTHTATQGRDHYVRIVYDGYLYPFGFKASLIKVTERVVASPTAAQPSPVAWLRQRMFVVPREKVKDFGGALFTFEGRELPFTQVRLDTSSTPNIDPPQYIGSASFWVDVGLGHFAFKLTGTDLAGAPIDFHAAMIFVSLSETDLTGVAADYVSDDAQRRCDVKGRRIAYADPDAGDTTFKTAALYFDTQILKPLPPWPIAPFLPALDRASVTVPTIAQLLGSNVAILIGLYAPYLADGLDPNAGVFATILSTPPGVGFPADKSGGLSTPNLTLNALSARKGLVSGSPDHAAAGVIDPSEYFGPMDAKLFGTIPLGGLIPIDPQGFADAITNAPEIRTLLQPSRQNPTQAVTRIVWSPDLQDYKPAGSAVTCEFFQDGQPSELSLMVRIVRPYDGTPPSMTATGKLANFLLTLEGVIALKVASITFTSQDHQKTIVVAQLANTGAITFVGPLSFLQELSNILPPGLFGGSGPSITTTPTALRVTYTLGLPPITCGIFSLQNIAIMTGLDLPYLDGKPGFEFGFASRKSPFLVTVEIFGGGGFVHLIIDADGVRMVEGAIEFGGNFAFDIGVASGGVHAMAGIYFQLAGSSTTLTGFVDIGGEVSVLGILSISLDLNLSLTWKHSDTGNVIQGRATMTVAVHILFFSASVSISVEKSFKAGGGDPQVWQLMNDNQWAEYANAFASDLAA